MEKLNTNPILGLEEIEIALIEAYQNLSRTNREPVLGRTLDGQIGYFINGQVQTPDGKCEQGYRI
jgi:hypothetical protein